MTHIDRVKCDAKECLEIATYIIRCDNIETLVCDEHLKVHQDHAEPKKFKILCKIKR